MGNQILTLYEASRRKANNPFRGKEEVDESKNEEAFAELI